MNAGRIEKIGDVRVTIIPESDFILPCGMLLPGVTAPELLAIEWLEEPFVTATADVRLTVQAFVVETPERRIVVDTCMGNDKKRTAGAGHMLSTDFLDRLEAAGYSRESIDVVLCTHLHVDHVGWNTMLEDGRWVPTFPAARYLIGRVEFDFWRAETNGDEPAIFADSIQPVVDAGLVDLVDGDHRIDSCVRLVSTPGHTPGHVSVAIESNGDRALITGDVFHTPAQIARPDWGSLADHDRDASAVTRRRMLGELGDAPVQVFGTHFPAPTCGKIVREDGGYRFET